MTTPAERAWAELLADPLYDGNASRQTFMAGFTAGFEAATRWLPIDENTPRDGRDLLLLVDWEPLTVVGFFGPSNASEGLLTERGARYMEDDGSPAWRVKWGGSRIEWGYDEPTHYQHIANPPKNPT